MGGSSARRSIGVFNQAHYTKNEVAGGIVADLIGIAGQCAAQAGFVRVNLRRNLHTVAPFVTIAAEVRRAGRDCAVAFVGVLICAATTKGLPAGFTMPGEFAGPRPRYPRRPVRSI